MLWEILFSHIERIIEIYLSSKIKPRQKISVWDRCLLKKNKGAYQWICWFW